MRQEAGGWRDLLAPSRSYEATRYRLHHDTCQEVSTEGKATKRDSGCMPHAWYEPPKAAALEDPLFLSCHQNLLCVVPGRPAAWFHRTPRSICSGFIATKLTKGMGASKSPEEGTVSLLHCLFNEVGLVLSLHFLRALACCGQMICICVGPWRCSFLVIAVSPPDRKWVLLRQRCTPQSSDCTPQPRGASLQGIGCRQAFPVLSWPVPAVDTSSLGRLQRKGWHRAPATGY